MRNNETMVAIRSTNTSKYFIVNNAVRDLLLALLFIISEKYPNLSTKYVANLFKLINIFKKLTYPSTCLYYLINLILKSIIL